MSEFPPPNEYSQKQLPADRGQDTSDAEATLQDAVDAARAEGAASATESFRHAAEKAISHLVEFIDPASKAAQDLSPGPYVAPTATTTYPPGSDEAQAQADAQDEENADTPEQPERRKGGSGVSPTGTDRRKK